MKRIMAFLLSLCVLSVFAPCLPVFAENEILIGTLDATDFIQRCGKQWK